MSFYAANDLFTALPAPKNPASELDRQAQRLRLEKDALSEIFIQKPGFISLELPWNGQNITIDLYEQNILSHDFDVRTGNWQTANYQPGLYYRGIIRGASGSIAAISFFENEIIGVLAHREWGNMNLGRKNISGNDTEYVFYQETLLPPMPFNDCQTIEPDTKTSSSTAVPDVTGCVRFFIESDYLLFQNKGSIGNTVNYISGFFNAVAAIYANEMVNISLSQVYVWTTLDPYDYTSSFTALSGFESYRTSFNGDLGHLVSLEGSGLGGVANLSALCSSTNTAFSGIYSTYNNYPAYSWTVNVVCHEVGHNLGSRHTHWCGWSGGAIDNCGPLAGYGFETPPSCSSAPTPPAGGGTIMSYCHLIGSVGINLANGFGPLPGTAVRNYVSSATCLPASCPTITCNAPTELTFSSITATSITVGWNAVAGATAYNLQYRLSPVGAWTTISNVTSPYIITGLSGNSTYEIQVQSVCGGNSSSYFTGGIVKTLLSACAEPSGLSATAVTSTSVNLNWTENGTATSWEIEWATAATAFGSGTLVSVATKPHLLSGLLSGTVYRYYVRATCGGTGNSTWIGPYTFNTPFENDFSANAVELTVNATCTGNIYSNEGATISSGEFNPTSANGGDWNTAISNTVWFKFVAPPSGTVKITTDFSPQGTNNDCQVALYSIQNPTTVNHLLSSAEDGGVVGNGYNPAYYYSGLTSGSTYYLQVDGWGSVVGTFCIEVHETFDLPAPATCLSYTQSNVNGSTAPSKWFNIYTRPGTVDLGLPVAAVKSTVNLGTVTVQEILNPLPIPAGPNGIKYMQRYYRISSSQNAAAARDIRLFYTESEFNDLKSATGQGSATAENLNISYYNGSNLNCSPADNTGNGAINSSVSAQSIGSSGIFYLQFNSAPGEYAAVLGSTPLPAELTRWYGDMVSNENILYWETATEQGIAKYLVQKSPNGIDNWENIGEKLPNNGSRNLYNVTDKNPLRTSYYRLIMQDSDGSVKYAPVIMLERMVDKGIQRITPNPANEVIYVEYQASVEQTAIFRITGYDGRLVLEQEVELEAGYHILPFDISALPAGLYYCFPNGGTGMPFAKR